MKVSELIEHLQKLDPDLECIFSSDDEGNSFSYLNFEPTVLYGSKLEYNEVNVCCQSDYEDLEEEEKAFYKKVVCIN